MHKGQEELLSKLRSEFKQEMQREGDDREKASLDLKQKMEQAMKFKLDSLTNDTNHQKEEIEKLTTNMSKENKTVIVKMNEMDEVVRTNMEKVPLFEAKLKKWIKIFEDTDVDYNNQFNDIIKKISEVEREFKRDMTQVKQKIEKVQVNSAIRSAASSGGEDNSSIGRKQTMKGKKGKGKKKGSKDSSVDSQAYQDQIDKENEKELK